MSDWADMGWIVDELTRGDLDPRSLVDGTRALAAPGVDPDEVVRLAGWTRAGRGLWREPSDETGTSMTTAQACAALGIDPSLFVPFAFRVVEPDAAFSLRERGQVVLDYVGGPRDAGWTGPFQDPGRPDVTYWIGPDGAVSTHAIDDICMMAGVYARKYRVPARVVEFMGQRVWGRFSDIVDAPATPRPIASASS